MSAEMPGRRLVRRAALDQAVVDVHDGDLLLGDSMGEMQSWYACADVVIMGGSLLPFGSQNLIEANALGCPVVLGPSTFNFEQAAAESLAAGAAVQVADADAAVATALAIAGDEGKRAAMSAAGGRLRAGASRRDRPDARRARAASSARAGVPHRLRNDQRGV